MWGQRIVVVLDEQHRLENMPDMDDNPVKEAPGSGYRVQIPLDGQDCAIGLLARYL